MKTTNEIKRENLRAIIDKYHSGVVRHLEIALNKKDGALSRYFSESLSARSIGPTLCREVEALHNLPSDWMSTNHEASGGDILSTEELMLLSAYRKATTDTKRKIIKTLSQAE